MQYKNKYNMINKKSVQKVISLITNFRVSFGNEKTNISNESVAKLIIDLEGETIDDVDVMTVALTLDAAENSSTKALEKVLTQLGVQ